MLKNLLEEKGFGNKLIKTKKTKNSIILAPIVYWTDKDIWNFIHGENIPYCSLYDEGFTRLGCIGCPLAGPKKQKIEFERWPRYKNLWWIYTKKFWDKWHNVPTRLGTPRWFESFKSADNYFNWWLSGVSVDKYNELVQKQAIAEYSEIPKDADCQSRFMTM